MPNPQTEWAAFAQPEELYRLMVEEAKDYAIFMLGPDRRFATWNDGAKRILGYEAAEILGQPSDIIFTSEDRARGEAQRELQTAEDEGRAVDERWHLRRDGTRFWGSGIVTALRDDAGRLQGFCKVMRDQTERKRLEEERDRLFKLSIDMLCVAGVDGFFKRVNSAFETTLGFTAEELTSRPIVEFQHPDDRAAMWRELEKLSRGEPTYNLENRFLCKDGGYKWTAWTYAPFTEEGLLYGVGRDFTRRKQAEEERAELLDRAEAARAEAEAANRTKDEFLATLSHELRTPLTAILGWTRILSAGKLSDSPGQAARALEIVERNARVQVQIVDDILDVSRIVAGKFRLEPRPALLQPIVEAAADTIRPAAEAKGIQLQAVFAPDAILISGDPERLQQAVWNLLANAVKFTPPGGSVEIRVERQGSDVDIVISDTGDGLSPDFLPYVFDRFRQADSSISRKHMGLGLGLAIVKHLIELHGGHIRVESDGAGQGSAFTIRLPTLTTGAGNFPHEVRPKAEDHFRTAVECPPSLSWLSVLVVDDDADTRALVTAVLGDCGAAVTSAGSVREALEQLSTHRPDVIVSDIGMPVENGYELLRRLRARRAEEGRPIPVIALTAYAGEAARAEALAAGFQVHLTKPVEPDELITAVARLADKRAPTLNRTAKEFRQD